MRLHLQAIFSLSCAFLSACVEKTDAESDAVQKGEIIYAKECSVCHGQRGEGAGAAALGLAVVPPDLATLKQRNDGCFPQEFVIQFIMGRHEQDATATPMPDFSMVGLRHVYPDGGADGEVLETDFVNLLTYLEAIQK
ncbi:MAG: c-type cytochrome [Loktanella sp.]|nr:c-type cytochrome [Loktanella sp.]